jgi:hypothetical protein
LPVGAVLVALLVVPPLPMAPLKVRQPASALGQSGDLTPRRQGPKGFGFSEYESSLSHVPSAFTKFRRDKLRFKTFAPLRLGVKMGRGGPPLRNLRNLRVADLILRRFCFRLGF